jgi:3-oxoacyl-[acyl-carrier-protein] synthase II
MTVAVTGWGLHFPGAAVDRLSPDADPWPVCPPEAAQELLGPKGLLGKDAATRLALCATHRALGLPVRAARSRTPADPRVGVVVSSNFGNVSTVQQVARTLDSGTLKDVSALDAPNASSNVIASTIAIWFRFGGPNMLLCSGATSGLDAIFVAQLLLRARRADRVLVVGVEPDEAGARDLHAARAGGTGAPLLAGAAAIVLERPDDRQSRQLLLGAIETVAAPDRAIDPVRARGDAYGAQGVLEVVLAAARAATAADATTMTIACGDAADGWRRTTLRVCAPTRVRVASSMAGE